MRNYLLIILSLCVLSCQKPSEQEPRAQFIINQDIGDTYTLFEFNAEESSDPEGPDSLLKYRWDWESDGVYDALYDYNPLNQHQFSSEGQYSVTLQVRSSSGLTSSLQKSVTVSKGSISPLDPFAPYPSDSSSNIIFNGRISWMAIDPDDDPMTYDLYLGNDLDPPLWKEDLMERTIEGTDLIPGMKYFWRIVAHDNTGKSTEGPLWRFSIHSGQYQTDTLWDSRDGQKYPIIKIGSYWWMTKNLNYYKDRLSKCRNDIAENCDKFGRYYSVFTRDTTICPPGWIAPERAAINDLEENLGMSESDIKKHGVWRGKDQGSQLSIDGTSGLNFTYDGYLDSDGKWQEIGKVRIFGSHISNYLHPSRMIQKGYGGILSLSFMEVEYVPVRCVKYD